MLVYSRNLVTKIFNSDQKRVLQLDRNNYYGSDTASLNLTNLWKMFRPNEKVPEQYGENRDWNVDLIPKFVMASGSLVDLLLVTNVSQYLEWKCVDGTFVYQWDKGGLFSKAKGVIHKVPANDSEALKSDLMGLFEKNRCRKFFQFIQDFDITNPKTYKGIFIFIFTQDMIIMRLLKILLKNSGWKLTPPTSSDMPLQCSQMMIS